VTRSPPRPVAMEVPPVTLAGLTASAESAAGAGGAVLACGVKRRAEDHAHQRRRRQ